jgi:hypothetical protein
MFPWWILHCHLKAVKALGLSNYRSVLQGFQHNPIGTSKEGQDHGVYAPFELSVFRANPSSLLTDRSLAVQKDATLFVHAQIRMLYREE